MVFDMALVNYTFVGDQNLVYCLFRSCVLAMQVVDSFWENEA